MFTHWSCVNDFKLADVLHEHVVFGEYTAEYPNGNGITSGIMGYGVNLDTWNRLNTEQQGWLLEAFRYGAAVTANVDTVSSQIGYKASIANGDKIVNIKGDGLKPWHDAMARVIDEWIANCDAKGITTAKRVYDTLFAMLNEAQSK
jgi:TRAP-type C4-dicarboxylate transport system substrate-binding protein